MRQWAPNLLLFLLLVFLLPIYLLRRTTDVLTLGILILAVALFLAYGNRARGIEMLAGMTAFVSLLSVLVIGQRVGGTNGGYCFVVLWLLALVLAVQLLRRRAVLVERGQVLVVNQLPTNRVVVLEEGLHRPLNPLFERKLAALPAYTLALDTKLDQINTRAFANVEQIRVAVRYALEQPHEVIINFPNREQAQAQLVRERGEPPAADTAQQVAFWTELIQRQMASEVDQSVRSVMAGVSDLQSLVRARHELQYQITDRLQSAVGHWGVVVQDVQLLDVVLDPAYQQAVERSTPARTGLTIQQPASLPAPTAPQPASAPDAPTQANPSPASPPQDETQSLVQQVLAQLEAQGKRADRDEVEQMVRRVLEQRPTPESPRRGGADDALRGLSN